LNFRFGDWTMSPSRSKMPTQLGPINRASAYLQKQSTAWKLLELQIALTPRPIKVWH
jgi:hypothetical protein